MNPSFREWLARRGLKPSSVSARISDVRRLEKHYGDLDVLYDQERCATTLDNLQYSKDDEKQGRPNPTKLEIDGNLYNNLSHFRSTLNVYCEFREATSEAGRGADPWDRYLERARKILDDGTLDRDERYKGDLGNALSAARSAVLADSDDWPQLLKDAIAHRRNNLVDGRAYAEGRQSNQVKLAGWVDHSPEEARLALRDLWAEDDRTAGDRVRAFNDVLPDDVFSEGSRSARLDAVSYLMMGLEADRFPPYRRNRFRDTYTWLGYPQPSTDDIGDEYEHALGFLDDLQAEAQKRGMHRPSTRLDAQSVVWSLSYQLAEKEEGETGPITRRPATAHALNTILYGPPGTGKTYATVRRCVEICDGQPPEEPEELRARYDALMDEGRIEFVTFHQTYGYEEFVEGLRPVAADAGGMRLEVVEGVLKRIAERARKLPEIGGRRIFKMSLGDPRSWGGTPDTAGIFAECIEGECVLLDRGGDIDWSASRYDDWKQIWDRWRTDRNPDATVHDTDIQAMRRFRTDMRQGDIVVASDGYHRFRAVGTVTGDYEFRRHDVGFHHRRAVRWHWQVRGRNGEPTSVFKRGRLLWRPICQMTPANPPGLIPYLGEVGDLGGSRPHVMVIDEINRANISKVMGELITLLEEDKRDGSENEVTVTLPHSGDRFTLPANLYILGTMNTADRSIALLDTALRRRFQFEEMAPHPNLLDDASKRTGVDLPGVLRAMNERLEYLVDRDHLIGHAWLMDAETRDDVDTAMRRKIIPLIAEYFYDDWSKVRAVLGGTNDFVERQRLGAPPGLDSDLGEARFRWTVRHAFPEDAYDHLVRPAAPDEATE